MRHRLRLTAIITLFAATVSACLTPAQADDFDFGARTVPTTPATSDVSLGFEPTATAGEIDLASHSSLLAASSAATGATLFEDPTFPTIRVTGFFQADAVWFHQDDASIATPGIGDVQDGADFRRARLAATGNVWENVGYMIEMDFAFPGRPSFMDVYLDIHDLPGVGNFRVGQWRQPFGMDGLTSVKELTFLERALPFTFLPFRQIGAGIYDTFEEDSGTWAVSLFRFPTDPFGGNVGDSGGYSMSSRMTALLVDDGDQVLHVGGNFGYLNPANNLMRYAFQPEVFVGETAGSLAPTGVPTNTPPFVDTGLIPTDNVQLYGAELAYGAGSFYAQAEMMWSHVNRSGGGGLTFPAAYAQAAYLLTGEHRPYNKKNGVFGRIKPLENFDPRCGGCGAWEVAARWSWIDLNQDDVRGGRLTDLTLGLNWYLNPFTKFQFNYIHAFLNREPVGKSDADVFALRAQLDF